MKAKKTSDLGKLNKRQWWKSLAVTIVTGALSVIKTSLMNSGVVDFKEVGSTAAIGAIGYIISSMSHNSEGKYLTTESKE